MAAVNVLAVMERSRNVAVANAREFPTSATLTRHADECQEAHAAVAELIEAASAYFNGYCQDEASEDGPEFTGCTQEQHEAANRLHAAIAKATQP